MSELSISTEIVAQIITAVRAFLAAEGLPNDYKHVAVMLQHPALIVTYALISMERSIQLLPSIKSDGRDNETQLTDIYEQVLQTIIIDQNTVYPPEVNYAVDRVMFKYYYQ